MPGVGVGLLPGEGYVPESGLGVRLGFLKEQAGLPGLNIGEGPEASPSPSPSPSPEGLGLGSLWT